MIIAKNSGLYSLGDSITVGQNATSGNSYYSKLSNLVGGSSYNQGVSGSGTCEAASRGVRLSKNRDFAVSILSGLNDIRRYGLNAIPMIKSNIRGIINAALSGDCVPANLLPITGAWTVLSSTAGGRGRALGGGARYTHDANATMTYSFTGTNLIVGSIANILTTSTYRDLIISIDGVDYELEVENISKENWAFPSILINNLADTNHTAIIKPKSGSPHTVVDYVGTLSSSSSPILIGQIPYITSLTYAGNTITLADIDAVNAEIESVVNEFSNYPVAYVKTNDFYDVATGISSDGIHPNNSGHDQIYQAFKEKIEVVEYLTIPSDVTKIIVNDEHCFNAPVTVQIIR